jgi:hypothetical protein
LTQSSETSILEDANETLFRQVHPSQFPNGLPSSEAFVPSERDKYLLSTLRERVGPIEAYRRWTEDLGFVSVGTYGITVAEIQTESLTAIDDAEATSQPDHASVDFTSVPSKGQRKQIGRRLRDAAVARGCLHQP